jgi:putative membrane-bound dehydrogenase-like protein
MNKKLTFCRWTLGLAMLTGVTGVAAETEPSFVPENLFAAPDGLEVTVWAKSPQLRNPTNMDVDKDGRIWVAEGVNYRRHMGRSEEGDRIVVIEDTDHDGNADKSWTFVQEKFLIAPLGVAVFDNKIVVSQAPDLIVYTDVNRNLKFDPGVDKREVVLTGFNGRNHDHSLHSVYAGPDGKWYFSVGNCGALFKDGSGREFRIGGPYGFKSMVPGREKTFDNTAIAGQKSDDGHVYIGGFVARMNPDTTHAEVIGYNFRNSYEQTVTSFGDVFQNDNDDPPACRVAYVMEYGNAGFASRDGQRSWQADRRPGQDTATAEWRQEDPGTMPAGDVYGGGSPTGVAFYENGALGDEWQGLLLSCEAGRNVVFGYKPKPEGAGFELKRFDFLTSNKDHKFAGSDFLGGNDSVSSELHTLFRPSDVCVGPDGAIYVADWFDPRVGGHADLDEGTHGAIYRIAPKGFKPNVPKIDYSTQRGQIAALKSPAVNTRHVGFAKLKERGDEALGAVKQVLADKNPYVSARAIWLMAQLGSKGRAEVQKLLKSKDERQRLVALRALRRAGEDPAKLARQLSKDDSTAVRRDVALSLRDVPLNQARGPLLNVARKFDGRDRHYLEAIGIGSSGKENGVYAALAKGAGDPVKWSDANSWLAWRLQSPQAVDAFKVRATTASLPVAERKKMLTAIAFIPAKAAASAMVELAVDPSFPLKADALWWLFNRTDNEWKQFGLGAIMKEKGLYDPEKIQLSAVIMPEMPAGPSKLPPVAEILKLRGDASRGKMATVICQTCHLVGAGGIDFGPTLNGFGKTQTREVLLRSIIDPSADISHGYDAVEVMTKDGIKIHGIAIAEGDPVIVKSMAGQTQMIPKGRIKYKRKLGRSLMFSADMLGLDPQTLMDIVAYLQSDME